MNHVLKHATTSAEQKAAYINPSLPIEARAAEEIAGFLIKELEDASERPKPRLERTDK
jgi:hypothetical protein